MLVPKHPRSLRARLTLIAAGLAACLLIPIAVVLNVLVRHAVAEGIWNESLDTASRVAASVRDGSLTDPVPTGGNGIDLVEVVSSDGRVIASSAGADGVHRLSPLHPAADGDVTQTTSCAPHGRDCLYVTVVRVFPGPGSDFVYAGRAAPAILTSPLGLPSLLLLALMLAALSGWAAWKTAGRVLRPVEAIRSELAGISGKNPGSRVPEPPGDDEIARLARTANDALARLDTSIQRQRQFAADASHELLTPICGIRAQLESARLHPEDTPEAVLAALRDTERLEAIVSDLLLLARIPTVPETAREEVDLSHLVVAELDRRPGRLPTRLRETPGVVIWGMRRHLARVVANLLDNAERHALTGVSVCVERAGDEAVLCVRNDGGCIPEADQERIFERFYRTDAARSRSQGGTGLGLAIAREVVEAHGGSIRVENVEDGVRFVLRLPLARGHSDGPGPGGQDARHDGQDPRPGGEDTQS